MKYRGLSHDDPLSYRSYWGFGEPGDGSDQKDPFVLAVKSRVKECSIIYDPYFPKASYSVVELKDNKPVAYYFDLNADGKLSDDEKFRRAAAQDRLRVPYAFITSDFLIQTENQQEIPFRVMVVGYPMGQDWGVVRPHQAAVLADVIAVTAPLSPATDREFGCVPGFSTGPPIRARAWITVSR